MNKSLFFARKFDPTVNQLIINRVEELLYGRYTDGRYLKWYNRPFICPLFPVLTKNCVFSSLRVQ